MDGVAKQGGEGCTKTIWGGMDGGAKQGGEGCTKPSGVTWIIHCFKAFQSLIVSRI